MKPGEFLYDKRHGVSLVADLVNEDATLAIIAFRVEGRTRWTVANESDVIRLDIAPELLELQEFVLRGRAMPEIRGLGNMP